ncbi:MAG: TonB-dependent receptor [Gammaproteobacteria bacterium]|nr:TonB-dependent receptor [Gammaproteobacteria bacterium]
MERRFLTGSGGLVLSFVLLAFSTLVPAVHAEERADSRVIEEIVVISTKRATGELAQEVPVASTVLSETMIAENNFTDLVEVSHLVPGADFRQTATFPGIQRFWLRAVGVSFSVPNFDPAVGVYQDGIFIAQNIAAILDTFDMESVEVLRGPQGTLFGRNTSVGAIVSRSRRPGDEFAFRAQGTFGSYDRTDFSVSVEGPIVEDKLRGKLSLQSRDKDGWVKDLSGGNKLGVYEATHARGTLVWTPTEELDVTLIGELYERNGDGAISMSVGEFNLGRSGHPILPGQTRKWDETYAGNAENEPWRTFSDHEVSKAIADVSYDAGHGVFTSISGYVDVKAFSGGDFEGLPSGSPLNVVTRLMIDQDQFSQELRYASAFSDTFDFTVGAFFFTQDLVYGEQRCCQSSQPNVFGVRPPGHAKLDHDSLGAFAELRFNLSEALTLTVGGRYTREEKDAQIGIVNFGSCQTVVTPRFETADFFECTGGTEDGFDIDDKETWKSFSPKVSLQYHLNDQAMLYTSWTRGYRSGGFSFRVSGGELATRQAQIDAGVPEEDLIRPSYYGRERVDNLEVGLKSDWWDNRLRFNVTGYYNWWDGIQRNLQEGVPGNISQRTANVDDSYVYGVEIEINAIAGLDMLTDGDMLRLDGAFAFAESGYDSDDYVILDPITLSVATDLTDQEFGAPHNTAFVAATYEHPVGSQGATLSWRASYWWKEGNYTEGVQLPSDFNLYHDWDEVDAQIQYTSGNGQWYIKAFGKNLTYDKGYVARVAFASNWGLGNPRDPRTYGLTVGFEM